MGNKPTRRQKIIYVITKSNWGGAQRYVYDLATSIPKDFFDVLVVLGGKGTLKENLEKAGVRTISLSSMERDVSLKKEFLSSVAMWKIFRKEKADIVHLNSSKAGGLGVLVARIAGVKKIIFTAHGWAFNEERPPLQKKIIYLLAIATVALSHKTIAVSKKVKEQIGNRSFITKKIVLIHNGIEKIDFIERETAKKYLASLVPTEYREKIEKTSWIGTIGELHKIKGQKYALEAIKILDKESDISFFIMGEGEERKNLEKEIAEKGLTNKAFLLGNVQQASKYLKAFDVFVLPSLSEGLAYVVLEAGSADLPVIASNVGGIPEIIKNDVSGTLVPPKDSKAIARAIKVYLEDANLSKKHAEILKDNVLTKFSIEKMIEETITIYK